MHANCLHHEGCARPAIYHAEIQKKGAQGRCKTPVPASVRPLASGTPGECAIIAAASQGSIISIDRNFKNVTLLLDSLLIAAVPPAGSAADVLQLVDLPEPVGQGGPTAELSANVWLLHVVLAGVATGGSVHGVRMQYGWRLFAQGADTTLRPNQWAPSRTRVCL